MVNYQPVFGNGGAPRGRRITDDTPDAFEKRGETPREHDRKSQRAANVAGVGALGVGAGMVGEHFAETKPVLYGSRAVGLAGGATMIGAAAVSQHHHDAAKRKRLAMLDRALEAGDRKQDVGKSRFYDPESRRQRRLGMYEAGLAGGAVAGLGLGGKGIVHTSRLARKMPGVVSESNKDAQALRAALRHGVAARRKDVGLAAGGIASGAGAFALNRHAESRRGRPMN